jgi:dipeptide transport system permease protein
MLLVIFCAIFAPWVAPRNPSEQYRDFLLTPPAWLEGGQMQFLLGTDELGRPAVAADPGFAPVAADRPVVGGDVADPGDPAGSVRRFLPEMIGPTIMRLMDIMLALPSCCWRWRSSPSSALA